MQNIYTTLPELLTILEDMESVKATLEGELEDVSGAIYAIEQQLDHITEGIVHGD